MVALIWRMVTVRRGHAVTVLLLAALAIGAAVAAPVFLTSARASLVQRELDTATPQERLLSAEQTVQVRAAPVDMVTVGSQQEGFDRDSQLAVAAPGFRTVFAVGLQVIVGQRPPTPDEIRDAQPTDLSYRDGFCTELVLVSGRCVSGPGEVVASPQVARKFSLEVGDTVLLSPVAIFPEASKPPRRVGESNGVPTQLTVVGLYTVRDPDDLYWGAAAGDRMRDGTTLPIMTDHVGISSIEHYVEKQNTIAYPLPGTLTVDRLDEVRAGVSNATRTAGVNGVKATSQMLLLLSRIDLAIKAVATAPIIGAALLIVLCWFVIFLTVAQTAQARRAELGMMKLRGLTTVDQWWLAAAETAAPLGVGAILGYLAAHVTIWLLAADDAGRAAVHLGAGPLRFAAIALVGAVLVSLAALRRDLGTPAAELMRRVPSRVRRWQGAVLITMAAALAIVAVVQVHTATSTERSGLALLAPALTILAAGLISAVAFDGLLGLLGTTVLRRGRLALGLGSLHLARRNSGSRLLALLTIAVALLGFASIGTDIAADQRQRQVDVAIGTPVAVQVGATTPLGLIQAVRRADPSGQFAMASVTLPAPQTQILAVDASALANASLWPVSNDRTATEIASLLRPTPLPEPTVVRGNGLRLTASATIPPGATLDITGSAMPLDGTWPQRFTLHLSADTRAYDLGLDCPAGCRLGDLALAAYSQQTVDMTTFSVTLRDLRQGASSSIVIAPVQFGKWLDHGGGTLRLQPVAEGLRIQLTGMPNAHASRVSPPDTPAALAAATAGPNPLVLLDGSGGNLIQVQPSAKLDLIPRTQTGTLVDLDSLTRADDSLAPVGNGEVWLSAHAPSDALARLQTAGLGILDQRTEAAELTTAEHQPSAVGLGFFLVVAALGIVLGAAGLAVSAGVERAARAEELRALRAQGLRWRTAFASGLWSYLITVVAALVLGGLVAKGAWMLTGSVVPTIEGPVPGAGPTWWFGPQTIVSWLALAVVLIAAGVVLVVALMRLVARSPRGSAAVEADIIDRREFATASRRDG